MSLSLQSDRSLSHFPQQWAQSRWHNPQKVVDMDTYLKDILGFVPSTLKPLYIFQLFPKTNSTRPHSKSPKGDAPRSRAHACLAMGTPMVWRRVIDGPCSSERSSSSPSTLIQEHRHHPQTGSKAATQMGELKEIWSLVGSF